MGKEWRQLYSDDSVEESVEGGLGYGTYNYGSQRINQ